MSILNICSIAIRLVAVCNSIELPKNTELISGNEALHKNNVKNLRTYYKVGSYCVVILLEFDVRFVHPHHEPLESYIQQSRPNTDIFQKKKKEEKQIKIRTENKNIYCSLEKAERYTR